MSRHEILQYLPLACLTAPVIHVLFSLLLGWHDYMPFPVYIPSIVTQRYSVHSLKFQKWPFGESGAYSVTVLGSRPLFTDWGTWGPVAAFFDRLFTIQLDRSARMIAVAAVVCSS
jgi:hypothetical protein